MSGLVSSIGTGFTTAGTLATQAFQAVSDFFNEYFIQPIKDFWDWLKEAWASFSDWASDAWTATGEFFTIYLLNPLSDFWTWCEEKWGAFASWGSDAWDAIAAFFNEYVFEPLGEFWTRCEEKWGDFGEWGSDAWDSIAAFFRDYIFTPLSDFWTWCEEQWGSFTSWGTDAWGAIGDFFSEYILTPIEDFWFWIDGAWDDLKGWGSDTWESIGDAWDKYIGGPIETFFGYMEYAWNYTSDTITDGWDSLTSIFDFEWSDLLPSWDWLDIIPGSLSDFFSLENLEMIWDGIGNLFSIAVQPIKDGVNFMTGVINDLIEYEFDYFFGSFSLSDAGVPTIPKLAKGGIVNKPTTAIIGEDGPEAVIPLTQRNNPQGIGLGGSTFNITVNAGGITDRTDKRSLAREIGNMIQQEMARNIGGATMRGRY